MSVVLPASMWAMIPMLRMARMRRSPAADLGPSLVMPPPRRALRGVRESIGRRRRRCVAPRQRGGPALLPRRDGAAEARRRAGRCPSVKGLDAAVSLRGAAFARKAATAVVSARTTGGRWTHESSRYARGGGRARPPRHAQGAGAGRDAHRLDRSHHRPGAADRRARGVRASPRARPASACAWTASCRSRRSGRGWTSASSGRSATRASRTRLTGIYGRTSQSTNILKLVPAARFTIPLAPQLGVYGDAGLGLYLGRLQRRDHEPVRPRRTPRGRAPA